MRKLLFSTLLLVLIAAGCSNSVCSERGRPAPLPFPHASVAHG